MKFGNLAGMVVVLGILCGTSGLIAAEPNYIVATFTVSVDETQTIEEAVAAGKFDWSHHEINSKNFPKLTDGQKSEKEVVLFHFEKKMHAEEIATEMDKAGYKPASVWDLLGLAVKKPDLQKEFPVVALGSVCTISRNRFVTFLDEDSTGRKLTLDYVGGAWNSGSRFAAVRK